LSFRAGTVFGQRSQLWYHLPARDTFELLAHVYELPRAEHKRRLAALVAAFDLGDLLDRPVRQLSLGERMRCEIAASLLHEPSILFLDEPTIGLDVSAKATIRDLLRRRSRENGATLLLTSHDTGDIEQVCDRVIVIHRGRVLLDGPVERLKRTLRTKRVTLFTEAERLELELSGAHVVDRRPHCTTYEVALDTTSVAVLIDAALKRAALRDVSIEDPPLDAVIRALYQQAEGGRAS
jgi:ABC-2 type transport system ATP-binding protein